MKIDKNSQIAVIYGGISSEREVSLRSGKNVYDACQRLGYANSFLFDFDSKEALGELLKLKQNNKIDAAILMTHGKYGEDGCLQGFLEILEIPYSGSKVEASSNCMNKITTKNILKSQGLPVLEHWCSSLPDAEGPYIIKPLDEGSSVGIVKIDNFKGFKSYEEFCEKYPNTFIEPFIKGTEITASVINIDAELKSLPLLELRPKNEFYDYEAKYTEGMTEFILPAEISKDLETKIHDISIRAFKALNCSAYSRVDFMIDAAENPYILELNTLPGMTNTSDMPAQAKAAGISYDQLVDSIIKSIAAPEQLIFSHQS